MGSKYTKQYTEEFKRDAIALAVPRVGRVEETGDPSLPYWLLGRNGIAVEAVSEFMLADDDSPASLRSYAYELLAWFRPVNARSDRELRSVRDRRCAEGLLAIARS
ncbi:hypothetical protein [Streptomyces sp. NPDC057729]|uniref:hypothetical protein n=1 Tax=Streptomyces sp. NPDC057729 TaxID=3346230 RepID=UPI0036B8BB9D